MSKVVDSGKSSSGDSGSGRLLHDIEEISKALYLHKTPTKALPSRSHHRSKSAGKTRKLKSKSVDEDLVHKDKKSSIWNWKPLKALTHIRNQRFNCSFFIHVHTIEGLPPNFNGLSLCIHWKRKNEVLRTRSAMVFEGTVEFEETLMHKCSVTGTRNGPHNSAKYEPKLFLLYASVVGAHQLDIGKHWIDLTRLLPLTLEELEEEKSSGKWSTSFKLSGKAKDAVLNVSFGFSVVGINSHESSSTRTVPKLLRESMETAKDNFINLDRDGGNVMLQRVGSVPGNSNHTSDLQSRFSDTKVLNELFPDRGSELARSITFLYRKLDEAKLGSSRDFDFFSEHVEPIKPKRGDFFESYHDHLESGCDETEFTITEQGTELPAKENLEIDGDAPTMDGSEIETIDVSEIFKDDDTEFDQHTIYNSKDEVCDNSKDEVVVDEISDGKYNTCSRESTIAELESIIHNLLISESSVFNSPLDLSEYIEQENHLNNKFSSKEGNMVRSLSLDNITESVANDFLNTLGIEQSSLEFSDSEPDSPRERLLRQFEEEILASENFIFDEREEQVEFCGSAQNAGWEDSSDKIEFPPFIEATEKDHTRVSQSLRNKRNAKILENLETEALMQKWGLNETAFQNSPRANSGGFGSPIYFPREEPLELPHLAEELGPILRTKNGGYLRSLSPSLFRYSKNGGRLIMQVSAPIVLPVEMGSSVMEILQQWATVGSEKMYEQAITLMPLEDITGKTMQQAAFEVKSGLEVPSRLPFLQHNPEVGNDSHGIRIEEVSSGLYYDDPSASSLYDDMDLDYVSLENLAPLAMDRIEALSIEGLRIQSGMSDEEAPSSIVPHPLRKSSAFLGKGVKLLELKDEGDVLDGLISMSISLDEWMRLDAGIFSDEDEISEQTSKIFAAHNAKYVDFISGRSKRDGNCPKLSDRRCGFLGNNLTLALMLQLRDPLRDFETVGAPMLALIQVVRVFSLPKPNVACEEVENRIEEGIARFRITEAHLAGLSGGPGRNKLWGTRTQNQSGARWLLSNCMGKTIKYPHSKANAIVTHYSKVTRKVRPGDALWSISSHVHATRSRWKELATLNIHIRNPDVIFSE